MVQLPSRIALTGDVLLLKDKKVKEFLVSLLMEICTC